MITLKHIVDRKTLNGTPINICRNFFIYNKPTDWFKITHRHFTYNEKKIAKQLHR